jgi:DNA-binding protein HU-beta
LLRKEVFTLKKTLASLLAAAFLMTAPAIAGTTTTKAPAKTATKSTATKSTATKSTTTKSTKTSKAAKPAPKATKKP